MTWALAKLAKLFAACNALRSSLKLLKSASVPHPKMHVKKIEILMFWDIYGLFVVFEMYFEWTIRWIPLYFYCKSFALIVLSFPSLRITTLVFHSYVVPMCEWFHCMLRRDKDFATSQINPWRMICTMPLLLATILFPFIGYEVMTSAAKIFENEVELNYQQDTPTNAADCDFRMTDIAADTSSPCASSDTMDTSPSRHSPDENFISNSDSTSRRRSLEFMRELVTGTSTCSIRGAIFDIHAPTSTKRARQEQHLSSSQTVFKFASPPLGRTSRRSTPLKSDVAVKLRTDVVSTGSDEDIDNTEEQYYYSPMHNDYKKREINRRKCDRRVAWSIKSTAISDNVTIRS